MFFVFFLVSLTSILSVFGSENSEFCDYKFGDPTWNYSKVFYNQDVLFPAGAREHIVTLPAHRGLMISYVCINLPNNMNKNTTTAAYNPLDREVSVLLPKIATDDFYYHIYAKRHGY